MPTCKFHFGCSQENELNTELMSLALLSSPEDMLDVAQYFEKMPGGFPDSTDVMFTMLFFMLFY